MFHNFFWIGSIMTFFQFLNLWKNMRFMQLLQIEVCRKILKDVWGETWQLTYKISPGAMVAIGSKPFISFERMYNTKRTHNMLSLMSNLHYQSLFPWLFMCWVGPRCSLNLFYLFCQDVIETFVCFLKVDPSLITKFLS